ncbi:MAG: protein kinase [Planctomycetia bacterium]|nr:protein kinase [Planctomycetia bacterium]
MSEPQETQPSDDLLDGIICEYLEAMERGEAVSQDAFLAKHPQFAPQLREFFSDWAGISDPDAGETSAGDVDASSTAPNAMLANLEDFELVREIGRGGMGQVFEARQKSLRRSVAIKAMSIGKTSARHGRLGAKAAERNTQELRGRFLREAEVTGGLQHPGIVPVYAVGAAEDGQPYYAMRLIEGESLHDAIEAFHAAVSPDEDFTRTRGLEFRKLLRRLIDVCNAIDYAHSQQVIHRDIKPRNVMLGRFGETLVVDWGLAKLATAKDANTGDTLPLIPLDQYTGTHHGSAVGTPAFMSPEQAAGELDRLGPASDVYSLGATLYCLLTGQPAFAGKDLLGIFEMIKRGEFPPPRAVRPAVPPALEAICLKAMSLERSSRYRSAIELADDLDRWLADEPLTAYQEPWLERCARWGRRHRTWLRAGVATLTLLAIGGSVAAWLINQSRAKAELRRGQAVARLAQSREATDAWLTGVSELIELYPDMQKGRSALLEKAATYYDDFAEQANDDPALELERGRTKLRLGDVRRMLDQQPEAEEAYRTARDLLDTLTLDSLELRLERANSRIKLAMTLAETDQRKEADKLYGEAIAIAEQLLSAQPERFEFREAWVSAMIDRASLWAAEGRLDEAERLSLDATTKLSAWRNAQASDARYEALQAKFFAAAAEIAMLRGKYLEASTMLGDAAKSLAWLSGQEERHAGYRNDRASVLVLQAIASRALGDSDLELQAYVGARAEYQLLADTFREVPGYRQNLALTMTDLAQVQLQLGNTTAAKQLAEDAIEVFTALVSHSDLPPYRESLAAAKDVLGQVLLDLDDLTAAQINFTGARDELERLLTEAQGEPAYLHRLAVVKSHLAQASRTPGELEQEYYNESRQLFAKLLTEPGALPAHFQSAALMEYRCGSLFFAAGDQERGRTALMEAKRHFEALDSMLSPPEYLDQFATYLVECPATELREAELAAQLSRRAVNAADRNYEYAVTEAAAWYRQEMFAECQSALENVPNGRAMFWLAMALAKQGDLPAAQEQLRQGQAWMQEHRPGNQELRQLRAEAEQVVAAP